MSRWLLAATVLAGAVLGATPGVAAAARGPLARYAPVVVEASDDPSGLTSVEAFAGRVLGVPSGTPAPTVYGRRDGPWLQYWLLFASNDQDRGVLRTGRHEGDWELVQYRLRSGRLVRAVYAQHAVAESCGMSQVRRSRGRPVVFLARGSHAAYFQPGVRDRTWPDPNDETDGRGLRVRPRLVRVSAESPAWMRYPGRWGASRAGAVPGEMDSPRGPAFQGVRWDDPSAWAASARPCTKRDCDHRGECDGRETAIAAVLAFLGLLVAIWYGVRRARRSEPAAA
jgi:hypothetical protein